MNYGCLMRILPAIRREVILIMSRIGPRKLLLHRHQIDYLAGLVSRKGLTLVPLKLYIKKGIAKLELGVAKGKTSL